MALPLCHALFQFHPDGALSCQLYQRSADLFSACLQHRELRALTRMVAQVCGLTSGEFIHLGDLHLYRNHLIRRVSSWRDPRPRPQMELNPAVETLRFPFR